MDVRTVSAFFDELGKIATAGDLMTPAVVSDSAAVDGPPATPFARRRGYKKLEQVNRLSKEAGWGRDFQAWALRKQRKAKRTVGKFDEAQRNASIKVFTKLPGPAQKALMDPQTMDASDMRVGIAAQAAKNFLKVGAAERR